MTAAARKPPHGGYPTPAYNEVSLRRRLTSTRIWGHPGASVYVAVTKELTAAGEGRTA